MQKLNIVVTTGQKALPQGARCLATINIGQKHSSYTPMAAKINK